MSEQIKSKTYYVLDNLTLRFAEELNKLAPYIDSLTEFEKKKLRLWDLIIKLGHRNETLAKLLYLENFYFFNEEKLNFEDYRGKRGKKTPNHFPLKLIMKVLNCSHRSAQAYQLYMKGRELAAEVFDALRMAAVEERISKEGERLRGNG